MTRLSDEEMENLGKYMASETGLRQAFAQIQAEAIERGKERDEEIRKHSNTVRELINTIKQVQNAARGKERFWESRTTRLIEAAEQLMRGDCWCEVGIGNPMVTKHSEGCIAMQRCFADTQQDGE